MNKIKDININSNIRLINGDCIEFMKTLDSESIDLILTDPPYGDGVGYGRNNKCIENNEDESINYKVIPELFRLLKRGGVMYLFTNWKFAGKIQNFIETQTGFSIRTMLVIVKNNFGMGYGFRNQHELCWVCEKDKVVYHNADFSNVQNMENIKHDIESHPHQKGINLISKMIKHIGKENDLVFDPFMGSGTTGVACNRLGMRFIGCELSDKYFSASKERIENELKQPNLI